MALPAMLAAAGWVGGLLVGLSGVGAGSLLTPLLILLGVPPATAVGSDFLYSLVTKLAATLGHGWQRGVHYDWVLRLALGSLPGVVAGSLAVGWLYQRLGPGAGWIVRHALGGVLALTAGAGLVREALRLWRIRRPPARARIAVASGVPPAERYRWLMPLAGGVVGFAVGFTSVGGGSLVALMLLSWTRLTPREVVGTDLAHAVLLAAAGTVTHWRLGTVEPGVVGPLLAGSVPGALLGSRLAHRAPAPALRVTLNALILIGGIALI